VAEPLPTTIGRYVVESLVGIGGMGQIFKSHDPDIRRSVAIKLISTRLMSGGDSEEYIRRFRREAQAAARCAHPNIVAVYDFALHEGQPFMAMEFVYGASLRQALDATPVMAVADAMRIMLQVLDALSSAHELGVIHQDIKPANIMLTPEMRVKVADFGISRFVNAEVTSISSSMGTPNYMSPEQCQGSPVDGRSDIFSAGATLFEMVAGARAFPGHNLADVSHRIRFERLPLLPAAVRAAAPRLQLVLERAMEKQPEDRFDTAKDMAEALQQVLAGLNSDGEADAAGQERTRLSPIGSQPITATAPDSQKATRPDTSGSVRTSELQIDPDTLRLLEEKLAAYVGPIARVLVRTTAGRSRSVSDLCSQLALTVADPAERERFRREVDAVVRQPGPAPGERDSAKDRLPEHELERVQEALAHYIGPIARVLVRRATADATSVEALWLSLSNHIESPIERTAFLRRRQGGAPSPGTGAGTSRTR
jgi:serine/threonine-protein kinase